MHGDVMSETKSAEEAWRQRVGCIFRLIGGARLSGKCIQSQPHVLEVDAYQEPVKDIRADQPIVVGRLGRSKSAHWKIGELQIAEGYVRRQVIEGFLRLLAAKSAGFRAFVAENLQAGLLRGFGRNGDARGAGVQHQLYGVALVQLRAQADSVWPARSRRDGN